MHPGGYVRVSARLQECICPEVRHRLSPYELLERLYLVVQYQFLRKSCLLQSLVDMIVPGYIERYMRIAT